MTTRFVNRLGGLLLATALVAAAGGSDDLDVQTGGPTETPNGEPTPADTQSDDPTPDPPTEPDPDGPTVSSLDDAEALWEAADLTDYDMTYREVCFCPEVRIMVTVRDGQVTETVSLGEFDPQRDGRTVESLFAEIRQAFDEGAASVNVEYDAELGHPTGYFIDFSEEMADEEFGITVESLTPA